MSQPSTYRSDIDGLRAVAVLAVLFYHAGIDTISGGFVGVDVFFVISGYLITLIIAKEIREGKFSIVNFYERRIRRIFPALFCVVGFTTIWAYFLFMPLDFKDFGQSVVAATLFFSNFLFWTEAGYFAGPAEMKPLLHTWSLAVEEQFYIVYPVLLIIVFKYFKSNWAYAVVPIALVSFVASVFGTTFAPEATFYLAHTRAWELMIGAILAFGMIPDAKSQRVRDGASIFGLGLITWSVFAYSTETKFPGLNALVPCGGTALLIYAGMNGTSFGGRLLSVKPVVFIGLISYSLYLWHWPLIVLTKYYLIREMTAIETAGIIALSFVASIASYKYIENPFRRRGAVFARRGLFAAAGGIMGGAIAMGMAVHVTNGLPSRISPEAQKFAAGATDTDPDRSKCHTVSPQRVLDDQLCYLGSGLGGKPEFIVWGDSHAAALMPAFKSLAEEFKLPGWFASYTGCPPLIGVSRADKPSNHLCKAFNDAMFDVIQRSKLKKVVLVARWSVYSDGWAEGSVETHNKWPPPLISDGQNKGASAPATTRATFHRGLKRTIEKLTELGVEVWLVGEVPNVNHWTPSALARASMSGRSLEELSPRYSAHRNRQKFVQSVLDELRTDYGFSLIQPTKILCGDTRCEIAVSGRSLYYDNHHLSTFGAVYLSPSLRPIFDGGTIGRAAR